MRGKKFFKKMYEAKNNIRSCTNHIIQGANSSAPNISEWVTYYDPRLSKEANLKINTEIKKYLQENNLELYKELVDKICEAGLKNYSYGYKASEEVQ